VFKTTASRLYSSARPRIASLALKGIVHFEINFWYVLAYIKGIQDVGVFVSFVLFSSVSHKMEVYGHHLKEHAQRSPI